VFHAKGVGKMEKTIATVAPRRSALGSEVHPGMTQFEFVSAMIMSQLIQSGMQTGDLEKAKEIDPSLKPLNGDQYFARRSCQLAKALIEEWEKFYEEGFKK
jgi:hypothetical protein